MAQKGVKTKVAQDKSEIVAAIPLACVDETAAVEFFEQQRWGDCPCCVHCGSTSVYKMTDAKTGARNKRYLWRCHDCKQQYTFRHDTVMAESRIPAKYWCFAYWAACSSKKGVAALEIKRQTGLSYKSALYLLTRIRHGMADNEANPPKLEGVLEADEVYIGGRRKNKRRGNYNSRFNSRERIGPVDDKTPVFAVVERGGSVRTRVMPTVTGDNVRRALHEMADPNSVLMTDCSKPYRNVRRDFKRFGQVNHRVNEYTIPGTDPLVHTNTIEGYFGLLRRGMIGVWHNVSPQHLHRYCSESAFKYNTRHVDDGERTVMAIRKGVGKRIRYKDAVAVA